MKFLADENLDNSIVRGVRRRSDRIDIVTIQEVGLSGMDDPAVLDWAAKERRILITHDVATITYYAYERMENNLPMVGVIEVKTGVSIGKAIADIVLIFECCQPEDLDGQIYYLPL